jgi:uncharacterized protein (DUF1800 family)
MQAPSDRAPDQSTQETATCPSTVADALRSPGAVALEVASAITLTACGGGGTETPTSTTAAAMPRSNSAAVAISATQAARFLAQASLCGRAQDIADVQRLGYGGWLDAQMTLPRSSTCVDWLSQQGYDQPEYVFAQAGADNMLWRKLLSSPDPLRQRVTLALSEILVVAVGGISKTPYRQFAAAAYWDILETHAFGNYRSLLEQVSTSMAMGAYLTYRGNRKANAATGSLPDENYARELMQLFTIGLIELNPDGTPALTAQGQAIETYTQQDVSQLARVFTGWNADLSFGSEASANRSASPMVQYPKLHETGEKSFIGTRIPAGTDGIRSLKLALDALMAHPNVGPFIGRQLIQRLVTSHPSPAYVARVSASFADNGAGVRGDLAAVVRAVLLDPEARSDAALTDPAFGKLREPMLRFVQWARTFGATDATGRWRIGDLSDPATRLGQSPMRAPSVFNFFRPGYMPPNTALSAMTVPEFQITTESSVAGYINFLQGCISNGYKGLRADYSAIRSKVGDPAALVADLNLLLAGGQLAPTSQEAIRSAIDSMPVGSTAADNNRLFAAITLVMASPEYITLK